MNNRLGAAFDGRTAFIAYITAGDPSLAATARLMVALERAGADIVELGVPFSDPIADGPVNQRAAERALKGGVTLEKILRFVARYRRGGGRSPIVLFTYFNPIVRYGLRRFARAAGKAGVDGVLVVDLPSEESLEYRREMAREEIATVFLASPTTGERRLRAIGEASTGFVYYVSRLGVTGAQRSLSDDLSRQVRAVRRAVRRPVAVGFGISTPAQARAVAKLADGVVVGSALVAAAEGRPAAEAARRVGRLAAQLARAVKGGH